MKQKLLLLLMALSAFVGRTKADELTVYGVGV